MDLFTSIKDLGWKTILSIKGHQWCAILPTGYQQCENSVNEESSYFITFVSLGPDKPRTNYTTIEMGKLFPSPFVHKYMVESCKYKGGGLEKSKQGMSSFLDNAKA